MLTVGSLFAGIGGLELGLERTGGFKTVWQVEIDDYATRVLERHWPHVRRWRDVTTFPPNSTETGWRDKRATGDMEGEEGEEGEARHKPTSAIDDCSSADEWRCDLICGGFPCQDISYAGKGAGLAGERSGLFYEVARIVGLLRPRYVLLENVAALLTRGLGEVLGTLASLGYDAEWHCVPAAAVGAPHIRDRVFIVAYTQSDGRNQWRTECEGLQRGTSFECSGDATDSSEFTGDETRCGLCEAASCGRRSRTGHANVCDDVANSAITRLEIRQHSQRLRQFAATVGARQWHTEPNVGRVAHGVPSRVDRLRCLGNAVVPQVAEFVGNMILDMEKETKR